MYLGELVYKQEYMKTELKQMFTAYWSYLAVNTACKLNLFDRVFEGQDQIDKIINETNWSFKSLDALANYLIMEGYLELSKKNTLKVTKKGNLLRENNPDGLYYACLNWADEHLNSWQLLDHAIKTGKSSFEKIYKTPFFEYLNENPEKLHRYHKAMYEYARDDYKELPQIINLGIHSSIMDVGGGYGAALDLVKRKFPDTKCILFDLKEVIKNVTNEKLELIEGNFFINIPKKANAIIMSRILHDWNNSKAILILENCFEALPNNGTLYVIENCVDNTLCDFSLLSLNMTTICESYERSSKEYIELCEKAGLKFQSSKMINELQTILIFNK